MTSPLLGSAYVATEDGTFISVEHQQIAEIINDYDPTLALVWIPPAKREPGDQPFAVVHSPLGQQPYVVFYADECDERLLARVFSSDNARQDVLSVMDRNNQAREILNAKKRMDEAEEKKDIVRSIIKSPKHKYKHNGVTYE